ncbi:hypothetical protein [Caulobacter sp. 17J65-9]|uniref:hypothetical protein n=1 Tax=Caulobacter sp. 17J65-9 TaxID=2709382 RepID=UPI0013CCA6FA|nr:hypothetical protein [Caulobacter sp. 17J65-9]NEX93364.1 hypothetical protein [Caulobacter sp. 17J65-9]
MRALVTAVCLLLAACATRPAEPKTDPLNPAAEAYVKLVLEIGELEPGYVDAYYGPQAWADAAKADKRSAPQLKAEADRLLAQVEAVKPARLDPMEARRRAYLIAHLQSALFRLDMIEGVRKPFQDEAQALFGVRPEVKPLSAYDPVLARVDALVPGAGPLAERVDAFKSRYVIPADRLDAVMRAAIAECRKRTLAHIALPADESFTLEFVTGKSWSGYNWYKGDAKSLIQINTDLPIFIDRAVDLGCHEGYPGHHTYNALLEERLTKGRGWVEFSVYPLYSPQSFIAEGSGNYGIDLAFPGEQRTRFEAEVLYPLAGLDPKTARAYADLRDAMRELDGARTTIAAMYLDGKIDRETAIALTQKYNLMSRARAEQRVAFTDGYRSYVINYGLGQDMVRAHVEKAGPDQTARWKAMETLLSEPALPSEL